VGSTEQGLFQQKPKDLAGVAQYSTQDSDYQPTTQVLSFTANIQPTDKLKLDLGSRSVGIDLGAVYGVNKIVITPQNAAHRVRQQDIRLYASNDNLSYTKITGWSFTKNTDGSMVLTFPVLFQARYLKINTIWDDRDIPGVVVDNSTVSNTAQELVKVWTLATSRNESYTYDDSSNRTSQSITTGALAAQTKNSQYYLNAAGGNLPWLASDGVWYYQYDAAGNRTAKAKAVTQPQNPSAPLGALSIDTTQEYWNYTWDLKNRLLSVSKNGAVVATYTYDAENLRVARVTPTDTKLYAFGRNGAIAYTKDVTANTARTYAYLYDTTIGWTDTHADGTQANYYATTDHLGSVTGVTDSTANMVWSSEYDPFGKASGVVGNYSFDGSYAGHEVDPDTGLVYMWNRWQDPETGAFISEDPAQAGDNFYSYAESNPLTESDPTGLEPHGPGIADGYGDSGSSGSGSSGSSGSGSTPAPVAPAPTSPVIGFDDDGSPLNGDIKGKQLNHITQDGKFAVYTKSVDQTNSDAGEPNSTPVGPGPAPSGWHSGKTPDTTAPGDNGNAIKQSQTAQVVASGLYDSAAVVAEKAVKKATEPNVTVKTKTGDITVPIDKTKGQPIKSIPRKGIVDPDVLAKAKSLKAVSRAFFWAGIAITAVDVANTAATDGASAAETKAVKSGISIGVGIGVSIALAELGPIGVLAGIGASYLTDAITGNE
jgi:RHS repeat-associated protein